MKRFVVVLAVAVGRRCDDRERCRRWRPGQGAGRRRRLLPAPRPQDIRPLGDAGPARVRRCCQEGRGSPTSITNADGEAQKQRSQADQCLTNGAKVVVLVSLDFGSSLAIEKAAKAKGAKVIEYDRQVVGGVGDIYISFDGKAVGVLQGQGVVSRAEGEREVRQRPGRRQAERRPDRQQLVPVQERVRLGPQPAVQERHLQEGPEPVRPRLGQPEGADDLRADARPDREQDRRRRRRERRSRRRGRRGAEGEEAEADPALRSGRDGAGRAEHHLRLADDDRVEGHACCSPPTRSAAAVRPT